MKNFKPLYLFPLVVFIVLVSCTKSDLSVNNYSNGSTKVTGSGSGPANSLSRYKGAGSISGVVTPDDASASLILYSIDYNAYSNPMTPDANGYFTFGSLPAGDYVLFAIPYNPNYTEQDISVSLRQGDKVKLNIAF